MSVRTQIDFLSQKVCSALITAGFIAATLTISSASNATPIVVTTTTPHLITRDGVVYISGVTGNTAANDFWKVTPIDGTSFSLQGSVGNGDYVSGGTVQIALIGGKILLGRQWVQQNQSRPRIIAIPVESDGLPKDNYAMADADALSDPQRAALLSPAVSLAHNTFEIQVWGGQNPPDQEYDFEATEVLRDQVIRSADELYRGNFTWGKGKWVDQGEKATTEMKLGHLFVFYLTIDGAIGTAPDEFTPANPGFDIDVYGDNTGTPELAAEIIK